MPGYGLKSLICTVKVDPFAHFMEDLFKNFFGVTLLSQITDLMSVNGATISLTIEQAHHIQRLQFSIQLALV